MMNNEKDFFKTCFDTVAGLEVKNESQAIAKEVILDEVENLQQRISRAIEYIKSNEFYLDYKTGACIKGVMPLIEILGGNNERRN